MQSNGTKLTVDGVASQWQDGEWVDIGGAAYQISYDGGTSASVSGSFTTPLVAVYPTVIINNTLSIPGEITLPDRYGFRTEVVDGAALQVLSSPMAALLTSGNRLEFKHVTGALTVKVHNSTDKSIVLDKIKLTSSKYRLSGPWTIDFGDLTGPGAPVVAASDEERSVGMFFGEAEPVMLPADEEIYVQIPVPPVGDDHKFTVQTTYHTTDDANPTTKQCYTRTVEQASASGHALQRGELGYVPFEATFSGSDVTTDWFPMDWGSYMIGDAFQLRVLSAVSGTAPELIGASYILTRNIDASGITDFTTIQHCAEFISEDFSISDLIIHDANGKCAMFDASSENIDILGLSLIRPIMRVSSSSTQNVSPLVSVAGGLGVTIDNVVIQSPVLQLPEPTADEVRVGGLVAYCNTDNVYIARSEVRDFQFDGDAIFSGDVWFGGMVGYDDYATYPSTAYITIKNSMFTDFKDGFAFQGSNCYFGGLLGRSDAAAYRLKISECYVEGDGSAGAGVGATTSGTIYIGSLVGCFGNTTESHIGGDAATTCTGNSTAGGFTYSTAGTAYIGNAANKHVCGQTDITYPNNQDASALVFDMTTAL